jgi:hypothetical protein
MASLKTLLHPDFWAEIPPGQFLLGLSDPQREKIVDRLLALAGYDLAPEPDKGRLMSAAEKLASILRRPSAERSDSRSWNAPTYGRSLLRLSRD